MLNQTIRGSLVDAIDAMTRLLAVCEDPNQAFELRIKIRELFQKLDRVIVTSLDSGSEAFEQALIELEQLTTTAIAAKEDLAQVTATLEQATRALTKVEKLVKGVIGVLAIL